jgi:pimeloyl-ACP methyl ester carboxylesterase
MRRSIALVLGLALFSAYSPVFGQPKKEESKGLPKIVDKPAPKAPSYKHLDGQLLVFVVNGVDNSTTLSDNLLELNGEEQLGLRIQMVPWSRQQSKKRDLMDFQAHYHAAHSIAACVTAIRKDAPKAHIYFVGHSAGARIVLAAGEMLPAKSVDRIITLSAAVSQSYDLTGALKASRYGIDNFFSTSDWVLDRENALYRNADGGPGHAAGKFGFRLCSNEKATVEAYRNLRQYAWTEDFCGNGGHYAWTMRHNLKKTVVPMFFAAPAEPAQKERPKMEPSK